MFVLYLLQSGDVGLGLEFAVHSRNYIINEAMILSITILPDSTLIDISTKSVVEAQSVN